ncbi:MAG TPA: molybdopterin-dependent oxidoreductase, partial [Burkholderiales bacterium]
CTRCVRFGQEIAGIMELGMAGRGENSEIVSFVGRAVESELSGNMIDLCPVGALTSEPFRYSARTWELSRRKSVSPHDALGANLVVQVKQNRVMRVLPLENDAVNECWLSDKDRFSYEGLNSPERLKRPLVRTREGWAEVDWEDALDFVAEHLQGKDLGVLASPHSTLEELYLAGKLAEGGGAADFRLRHADFSADGKRGGIPWLGMPIVELQNLDRVLVIGSFLRKESPLIAQRLRQAAKRGAQVHMLHSVDDDWLMPLASRKIVAPSDLPAAIAQFGEMLKGGKNAAVLIGNFAQQHPQAAQIHAAAQALGVKVGFIGEAANSVGGYFAGLPVGGNVSDVLKKKAILVLGAEPELDCANPQAALAGLRAADFVVQLSPWKTGTDYAHAILPVTPFTESAGTFVNIEGRAQAFHATVNPLGEARPGWKLLRVLGTMLNKPAFGFETIDDVRRACAAGREIGKLLSNTIQSPGASQMPVGSGLQRIADVPIYAADPLVRRSPPLQKTKEAQPPKAWMNSRVMRELGVSAGQPVTVKQGDGTATLAAALDDALPDGCVRVAAAHPATASLGAMSGAVSVQKATVQQAA